MDCGSNVEANDARLSFEFMVEDRRKKRFLSSNRRMVSRSEVGTRFESFVPIQTEETIHLRRLPSSEHPPVAFATPGFEKERRVDSRLPLRLEQVKRFVSAAYVPFDFVSSGVLETSAPRFTK